MESSHIICFKCMEFIKKRTGNEINYMIKCNICNMEHKTDTKALKKILKEKNDVCCLIF